MKDKNIALVGLGRMGANMARRLYDCGYNISAVFDLSAETTQTIAQEVSATACTSLAQVTSLADIIFTVVTDDAAMESIFFGPDKLLTKADQRLFINCATLSPHIHLKIEQAAQQTGAHSLEACMASSIPQARNGQLYLIVAGNQASFQAATPLLQDLSKDLRYVGSTGKAAQVKALVNMVMNINTAALAEGLGLGQALGLDLPTLCEIFSQTGAHSRVLETDAEDMIQRDHDCYFSAAHAAKDSAIALDLAQQHHITLPLAQATLEQYQKLIAIGAGELDKSAIAELTFPGRGQ